MKNTYWNHSGTHQVLAVELYERIPEMGIVTNPSKSKALERFRKAQNAYYDVFNNGGCNRGWSISRYFGKEVTRYLRYMRKNGYAAHIDVDRIWERICEYTEPKMDALILEAAQEQKLS